MQRFDIRRFKTESDSTLGGVTVTSTAIETRHMDLQTLNGQDILRAGALRLEANYKAFLHFDSDIREEDVISSDSGITRYQVTFVENLFNEHIQCFLKKVD